MSHMTGFIQLLLSGANAILTLEGQNTTCADVFYVWVCIAYHVEHVLALPTIGVSLRSAVVSIYNHCFQQMMSESSHRVFLLAYYFHPCMYYSLICLIWIQLISKSLSPLWWSAADFVCSTGRPETEHTAIPRKFHNIAGIGSVDLSEGAMSYPGDWERGSSPPDWGVHGLRIQSRTILEPAMVTWDEATQMVVEDIKGFKCKPSCSTWFELILTSNLTSIIASRYQSIFDFTLWNLWWAYRITTWMVWLGTLELYRTRASCQLC